MKKKKAQKLTFWWEIKIYAKLIQQCVWASARIIEYWRRNKLWPLSMIVGLRPNHLDTDFDFWQLVVSKSNDYKKELEAAEKKPKQKRKK